jgi:hypothetical protein
VTAAVGTRALVLAKKRAPRVALLDRPHYSDPAAASRPPHSGREDQGSVQKGARRRYVLVSARTSRPRLARAVARRALAVSSAVGNL